MSYCKLKEEKLKISEFICKWIYNKEKALNITSIPYNSSEIFIKVILEAKGKKILYITEEIEEDISIINNLKKYTDFRDYAYVREKSHEENKKLIVTSYKNVLNLNKKFDLVICDEINSISNYLEEEAEMLMEKCLNKDGKIIFYSVDTVLKRYKEIVMPIGDIKAPMIEPRVITTKIDLNLNIPYMAYDYIDWSLKNNKSVIIYVPDEEKIKNVYNYMEKYYKKNEKRIIKFTKLDINYKRALNSINFDRGIFITDYLDEQHINFNNTNIMVLFANDNVFNFKNIVKFCGRVEKRWSSKRGEVILLAPVESDDMEKAKSITRRFNKEAWELGFLNI